MDDNRAESFLRLIRRSQRGRLKIYLGYAAGVGKTYQMLQEARRLKEDGIDVSVGAVETHGRPETEALLEGLERIPCRKINYRGIGIEEMDLGAVLSRRPSVALVDELAHTNVPGSKNAKRYQDVEELLAAGIHVISAMNIQHLESLYETVERATGVRVRERVPDRIVADADQLVNVDVTPEDLRRRLQEGKVYTAERVEVALEHFFKPKNLTQLRELALRELAAQIDSRQRLPLGEMPAASPDQIMVCLSSKGPNSAALLRFASRLAGRLNRNWYAVYVQTSREGPTVIDASTQRALSNTLTLAQQLGATVFTYKGDDVVKAILQFAQEHRVGHIVIGSPGRPVPFWRKLMGAGSVLERLIAESHGMTVVVHDTKASGNETQGARREPSRSKTEAAADEGAGWYRACETALAEMPVIVWESEPNKEKALRQLLEACCGDRPDLIECAWTSLAERERLGGTFVGQNVVLPHARVAGLDCSKVAMGVVRADGPKSGDVQPRIMLELLSPMDDPEEHVRMLGVLSRMTRDDQWLKEVSSAHAPEDVRGSVKRWQSQHVGKG